MPVGEKVKIDEMPVPLILNPDKDDVATGIESPLDDPLNGILVTVVELANGKGADVPLVRNEKVVLTLLML